MRAIRTLLIAAGTAMMAFALVGVLTPHGVRLNRYVLFLVGTLVLHDVVLAPLFLAVGVAVRRLVPPAHRAIVQGALIATAAVTLVATPFVLGYGRTADVPSALPRDYLGGYLLTVSAVWLAAAVLIVVRQRRASRRPPRRSSVAGAALGERRPG